MTISQLKSVLVRDSETHGYQPLCHNLSLNQAVDRIQALFDEERTGRVIDQDTRHRATDPLKCKACKVLAERISAESGDTSTEPAATT